jgi:hypothetical protein
MAHSLQTGIKFLQMLTQRVLHSRASHPVAVPSARLVLIHSQGSLWAWLTVFFLLLGDLSNETCIFRQQERAETFNDQATE